MKLSRALNASAATLSRHGVEDPLDEAVVLLGHAVGLGRAAIYASSERELTQVEQAKLKKLVKRRLAGEPSAYILGHRQFYGLELYLDDRVLVPRPETEILVDTVLGHIRQSGRPLDYHWSIADVGTGSGAIAIALAKNIAVCRILATDISVAALEVAAINISKHSMADKITLICGDLLEPFDLKVDIIVANLPYIAVSELPALQREVNEHEPDLALNGGQDGLDLIWKLQAQARSRLLPGGALFMEVGMGQAVEASRQAGLDFAMANVSVVRDYAGIDRVVAIVI